MRKRSFLVFLIFAALLSGCANETALVVDEGGHQVAVVVGQLVEEYLAGCHLVLAATTQDSLILQHIIRRLPVYVGSVVVEAKSLFIEEEPAQEHLLQGLWGEPGHTCRALILHLTNHMLSFRILETSKLWMWPETRVVILGERQEMEHFLQHASLRNTKHIIYLALHFRKRLKLQTKLKQESSTEVWSEKGELFQRCLYCNNGGMDVQRLVLAKERTHHLFLEEPKNFKGHKFQIVALPFFPVSDFKRDSQTPGTTMTPSDSIDMRILNTIAAHANFTYEVREPWDGQWGREKENGNWTGTIGTLQHQMADFSQILTPTPARIQAIQFSSTYVWESLVILSLKSGTLPQNLAIIRPFTGEIWLMLFVSFLMWSVTLWLLQKAWSWTTGGPDMEFNSTFLYGWGVLMEESSCIHPVNLTGRVLAGLWLMTSLILTNVYRSSLMSHLIVQDKLPEINSIHDMVDRVGWDWGFISITGSFWTYFKTHPDPDFQIITERFYHAPTEEQFRRVLEGGYSFITYKYSSATYIAASYTDSRGYTPIHVSSSEYVPYVGEAWGFRKGAPFRHHISMMMQHLMEGGFIGYWLQDILTRYTKKGKEQRKIRKGKGGTDNKYIEVHEGAVVLELNHLQGAFYLLLVGCGLSGLALIGEILASRHSTGSQLHMQQS